MTGPPLTLFPDDALDPTKPRAVSAFPPAARAGGPPLSLFPDDQGDSLGAFPSQGDDLEASRLRQSARLGARQQPDAAGRLFALQVKTGLPRDLIERNLDVIEAEAERADFNADEFRKKSPIVAEWLAKHPDYFALAKDDLDQLTGLEAIMHALKRGVITGRKQAQADRLGFEEMKRALDPATAEQLRTLEGELEREPTGSGFLREFLYPASKIVGQMVEGGSDIVRGATAGLITGAVVGPVGMVAGTVAGAAAGFGHHSLMVSGGGLYRDLGKIRGANGEAIDDDTRRNVALGAGMLSVSFEMAGLSAVAAPFKQAGAKFVAEVTRDALIRPSMRAALGTFGRNYAVAIGGETATEAAQELVNVGGETLAKMVTHGDFATVFNDPEQRELLVQRLAAVTEETAKAMMLLGLPGASASLSVDVVQARRAKQREQAYGALFGLRQSSKTDQRFAPGVDEIIERATAGSPIESVYLDVEPFREYFQEQGKDAREVARDLWGSTVEYDQALQAGGMMSLPAPRFTHYAARSTDHAFFAREWRRSPDDMNGREAEQILAQAGEQSQAEPVAAAGSDVEAIIAERLQATERYRPGDAATLAQQMAAFLRTVGQRAGIEPLALLERYGIHITPGDPESVAASQAAMRASADPEMMAERDAIEAEGLANLYTTPRAERDVNRRGESGAYVYARTPGGTLRRNLTTVTTEGLVDEYRHLFEANNADEGAAALQLRQDENFHSTEDGRPVLVNTPARTNALGRQAARNKSIAKLEAELQRRGITEEEIGSIIMAHVNPEMRDEMSFGPEDGEFWQSFGPVFEQLVSRRGGEDAAGHAWALATRIFEQREKGPRGRIRIDDRTQKAAIDLFESADWSTFLHESGHLYLEILGDLAGENAQIAADYAAILKYLGVQTRSQIVREHHEKFARAAEAYFMEAKAPSHGLRKAFYRFQLWLETKYSQAEALGVSVTPEIRKVFDRMFASDAEIDAAENEAQVIPIFTTAEDAGMSETEFAAYRGQVEEAHITSKDRLRVKLMREMLRERETWWKEEREMTRSEVDAELSAQPVYVVLAALQQGQVADGTPLEVPIKLSRADIVQRKGPEFLRRLPRPYVYSREGGLNADQVAESYGYESGDALLTALANTPSRKQAVEAETDKRMAKEFGDIRRDGSITEAAEEAVLGEHREEVIRAELRALNAQIREAKPYVTAARKAEGERTARGEAILRGVPSEPLVNRIAQGQVAGLRVRDIKPHRYWVVARRSSRAAIEAVARKDYVGAANAKQAELLNLALYREAQRVLEETEATATYARRLQQPASQHRLGKAGQDYRDQINKMLERFDFRPLSLTAMDRRASLASFIRRQEADGVEVQIPEELQNEAFRMPWREMTPDELRGVRDALKHLDHLASLKNRMLKAQDERALAEVVSEIVGTIEANAPSSVPRTLETRLPNDEKVRAVADFFASHRKLSSLVREMDGFQDGGALWQHLMRPLNEAADAKALLTREMTTALHALFEKAYSKADMVAMFTREYQPPLKASLSKMGRLMVALNWGAIDNREKLLAGLRITTGQGVEASQVDLLIDTLDKRDLDFVQSVWDLMDSYWPQMQALAQRVDGVAPEKIEAAPISTRHGQYRGGYFPVKYDSRQANVAYQNEVATAASKMQRGAAVRASTKAGSRNERVAGVRMPLRLDFGVIFSHFEDVALDLTHTEALFDVSRLVRSDEVASAIRDRYGDVAYSQIRNALEDISKGDVAAANTMDRALNYVRSGASIAAMGWNLTTAALQPLGLTQSMVRVGPKWIGRGIARWLRDAASMENTSAWIQDRSAFMRMRASTQMREINEIRNRVGMNTGKVATTLDRGVHAATGGRHDMQDVQDTYFWFITRMQLVADIPTWLGAYEKAMSDPANTEARAFALADQAVMDSQGGGQLKDLAGIQRGSPAQKLFTNFYSFFNTAYNLNVENFKRTEWGSPLSVGRFAVDALLLNVVPAALGMLLKEALRGDEPEEGLPERLLREQLGYLSGQVVLLREFSGFIQGFHGYDGPAGARAFSEIGKLAQQVGQGEADRALFRSLNNAAGILLHYPANPVQKAVDGIMAIRKGSTNRPTAVIFGAPR